MATENEDQPIVQKLTPEDVDVLEKAIDDAVMLQNPHRDRNGKGPVLIILTPDILRAIVGGEVDGEDAESRLDFADIGARPQPNFGQSLVLDFVIESLDPQNLRDNPLGFLTDTRLAQRLTFYINSSTDQDADIQVFGSYESPSTPSSEFDIGDPVALEASKQTRIAVKLEEEWHPYTGLRVSPVLPSTRGQVSVLVRMQKWFPPRKK